MGLINVVAISEKTISVNGVVYKLDGVDYSKTGNIKFMDWLSLIISDDGGTGTIDYEREFTEFTLDHKFEVVNSDLADLLGLDVGTVYASIPFYSNRWGTAKLVLQNALKDKGKINSMLSRFEEIQWDFENNTEILRGFAPESDYDKDNDRSVYKADIVLFPGSKKQWVKDFLHFNGSGTSANVRVHGLDYKISNTKDLNLVLSLYKGFKDQYSTREQKTFSIGFIESV